MFKIGDIVAIKGDDNEFRVVSVRSMVEGYVDINVEGTYEYIPVNRATLVQPTTIPQRYSVGDRVYYNAGDSQLSGEYLVCEVETYYVIDNLNHDQHPMIPGYTIANTESDKIIRGIREHDLERQTDYSLF